jgi:NTE family protein
MTSLPRKDTLIFQVDLWSAAGELPKNLFQIMDRMKDIQYSSKTRSVTTAVEELHNIRKTMQDLIERIPAAVRKKDPYFDQVFKELNGARNNCIQLIYKNKPSEGHYKDVEFSHETMRDHWKTGLTDVRNTLEDPSCLDLPEDGVNFVTYDVHHRPT